MEPERAELRGVLVAREHQRQGPGEARRANFSDQSTLSYTEIHCKVQCKLSSALAQPNFSSQHCKRGRQQQGRERHVEEGLDVLRRGLRGPEKRSGPVLWVSLHDVLGRS